MCQFSFGAPSGFSGEDIEAAARLIKTGGALPATVAKISERIKRSRTLGLCKAGATVVGVVSIKEPYPSYRKKVFNKAGVEMSSFSTAPELGYVTVHEDWRGRKLAQRLVGAALGDTSEACYATTDDASMKAILSKAGFCRQGAEWKGARGLLSLWTLE